MSAENEGSLAGEDHTDYERMLDEFGLRDWMIHRLMAARPAEFLIPFPRAVSVELRPSTIHGEGLFVTRPIAAGEPIAPARIAGNATLAGRYINHARHPNAELIADSSGDLYVVAVRCIATGEEVTNDYRLNARLEYASLLKVPLAQVTRAMVRERMRSALAHLNAILDTSFTHSSTTETSGSGSTAR